MNAPPEENRYLTPDEVKLIDLPVDPEKLKKLHELDKELKSLSLDEFLNKRSLQYLIDKHKTYRFEYSGANISEKLQEKVKNKEIELHKLQLNWRYRNNIVSPYRNDLSGKKGVGVKIENQDLRSAEFDILIRNSYFGDIDFSEAIFSLSEVSNSTFHNCTLRKTKFRGVKLNEVNFYWDKEQYRDLTSVDFYRSTIKDSTFFGGKLSGSFHEVELRNSRFENVEFTGVKFKGGLFNGVEFKNTKFSNINFSEFKDLTNIKLTNCVLNNCRIENTDFSSVENLVKCRTEDPSDIQELTLKGCKISQFDFDLVKQPVWVSLTMASLRIIFGSKHTENENWRWDDRYLINHLRPGVNGVMLPRDQSVAFLSQEDRADDMLGASLDATLSNLRRSRNLMGFVLLLVGTGLAHYFNLLELGEKNQVGLLNIKIGLLNFAPLAILLATLLMYQITTFTDRALKLARKLRTREDVTRVANFPWVFNIYVPFAERTYTRQRDILPKYWWKKESFNAIGQNVSGAMALLGRFSLAFSPFLLLLPYGSYEYTAEEWLDPGSRLFLMVPMIGLLTYFCLRLFLVGQKFQLPLLFDPNIEKEQKRKASDNEERIFQALEKMGENQQTIADQLSAQKDSPGNTTP